MENEDKEIWVDVRRYPNYKVSSFGRVYSKKSKKILKQFPITINSNRIVLQVRLSKEGKAKNTKVHRIVIESFNPTTRTDVECCHNNGIEYDNRLSNLRWGTRSENAIDMIMHAHGGDTDIPIDKKLRICEVEELKVLLSYGVEDFILEKMFKVSHSYICNVKAGRVWHWLDTPKREGSYNKIQQSLQLEFEEEINN